MNYSDNFSSNIIAALLSSIFTACFVWLRGWWVEKKQKKIERQNLAKALCSEISTLIEIYKYQNIVSECTKLFESLPMESEMNIASLSSKYVIVYERQLDKLGILDAEDIPAVIELYIFIKILMDSTITLADKSKNYLQYAHMPNFDVGKKSEKYKEMLNSHKVTCEYQEKVYKLYPDILKRLSKYANDSKED